MREGPCPASWTVLAVVTSDPSVRPLGGRGNCGGGRCLSIVELWSLPSLSSLFLDATAIASRNLLGWRELEVQELPLGCVGCTQNPPDNQAPLRAPFAS